MAESTATLPVTIAAPGRPSFAYTLAALVLVASLLLVLLYWSNARERGLGMAEDDFRAENAQALEMLRQRLINYELLARGGASFQASLQRPSRVHWRNYVAGLDLEVRFPELQAFGYAMRVEPGQLRAVQQVVPGITRLAIDSGRSGDPLAAVLYLEPHSQANRAALGVDLYARGWQREALREAADTASVRLSEVSSAAGEQTLSVAAPVYAGAVAPEPGGGRWKALRGWVVVELQPRELVAAALHAAGRGSLYRIVDVSNTHRRVVYADPGFLAQSRRGRAEAAFSQKLELETLGRRWRLEAHSAPLAEIVGRIPGLRITLVVGLLASLLLTAIALVLARTQSHARALAQRMSDSYRRSEQRFRSAIEYSAIGQALLDRHGRIIEVNPALAQIMGVRRQDLIGTMLGQHFVEWEENVIRTVEREAIADGVFRSTRRLRRSDGDVRLASLTFAVVPQGVGEGTACLVQVEDVTERVRTEERVQALNRTLEARVALRTRELRHVNQELERFAYGVSHDLRAPLRSIDGFSRLLDERNGGKYDPLSRDYLRRIRAAAARMSDLIDALLKMSRLSRGEMTRTPLDLSRMATEVVSELRGSEPGRRVRVEVAPGLSAEGDASLVRNLLENLIGNAWKFTRDQPDAEIVFGCNRDGEFFIRDNGAGFAAEYADKLFQPFQRLHGQEEFPGHGIGLASVKRIVERHGGAIRAESKQGNGAIFHFTLPGEG